MTVTKEKIKEDIRTIKVDTLDGLVGKWVALKDEQEAINTDLAELQETICNATDFDNETVKLNGLTISSSKRKSWSQEEIVKLSKLQWAMFPFKTEYKPLTGTVNDILKQGGKDAAKLKRAFTESYTKPTFKRS